MVWGFCCFGLCLFWVLGLRFCFVVCVLGLGFGWFCVLSGMYVLIWIEVVGFYMDLLYLLFGLVAFLY